MGKMNVRPVSGLLDLHLTDITDECLPMLIVVGLLIDQLTKERLCLRYSDSTLSR